MRIAKKQNSALSFKTPVGIVNDNLACCQASFVKILSAVKTRYIPIALYFKHIKSLELQISIEC